MAETEQSNREKYIDEIVGVLKHVDRENAEKAFDAANGDIGKALASLGYDPKSVKWVKRSKW